MSTISVHGTAHECVVVSVAGRGSGRARRVGEQRALLKRLTDIAVSGDTRPVDIADRDWFHTALSASTLQERIESLARGTAELMDRARDLFEVVQQAQPSEPLLAEAFRAGREATRRHLHTFVRQDIADGLVGHGVDGQWLQETTAPPLPTPVSELSPVRPVNQRTASSVGLSAGVRASVPEVEREGLRSRANRRYRP